MTLLYSLSLWSYELVVIQSISNTEQSFVTRTGLKDNIQLGQQMSFTSDDVSILAKAKKVTRNYTLWEIINDYANIPFRKGQTITMYKGDEFLWTLQPQSIREQYLKTGDYETRKAITFYTSLIRALSESVSGVDDEADNRGGLQAEIYFDKEINLNLAWSIGGRYTTETINTPDATIESSRLMGIVEGRYNFNPTSILNGGRFSIGLGLGYGTSASNSTGISTSGSAFLLPITKFSANLILDKKSEFIIETAFESLETNEQLAGGDIQTSNVNNFKVGLGYRRYF